MDINKIYNCDCFELIKKIPDNYLDLIIVDPPYGDGVGYGRKNKTIINNENESINYKFLKSIYPKMKNNTSLYLFSNHKFVFKIKNFALENQYNYRMLCIMVKNNIGMGFGFRNQYEVCLVLEKGKPKYNKKNMSNVWKMKHINHNNESHPHKKDYDIIRNIILHSSKENDLIFDGFMGSFSTAIACHKEKRNYIGSELDLKWYNKGIKELNAIKNQTTLF
jgi:site-specific DNA-methyltransferase (adenine-specific)